MLELKCLQKAREEREVVFQDYNAACKLSFEVRQLVNHGSIEEARQAAQEQVGSTSNSGACSGGLT